jgi:hypothetical protein
MKTRIPIWILPLAIVMAFGGGAYLGFHCGWRTQEYLEVRHDLGARIYYVQHLNSMARNNEMAIVSDTLVLDDRPKWMGRLEHREGQLAPEVIQSRKDIIAVTLKKVGGPLISADADRMSREVVDDHLSHPDLYIP